MSPHRPCLMNRGEDFQPWHSSMQQHHPPQLPEEHEERDEHHQPGHRNIGTQKPSSEMSKEGKAAVMHSVYKRHDSTSMPADHKTRDQDRTATEAYDRLRNSP